ncbi:TIGR04255 family protein [Sphingomonas bacterium]|uniref:TIGR04255 family protein n=1 Tax=Sphingomonas bacterium TaxID=1895847 RepID=UPI00157667EF|nr:TIGR04255 family protein [Sphingomonas bacterium]
MTAMMIEPDEAPIVQLFLTVSFTPALSDLSILDLADVQRLFRDEFPVFKQLKRAGPMSFQLEQNEPDLAQIMGLPRLAFASESTGTQVLFQNDRVSFSWNRTSTLDAKPDYPGFDALFTQFKRHIGAIVSWAGARDIEIAPSVGELAYTDAFTLQTEDGTPRCISDIFGFVSPPEKNPAYMFDYSWAESLPDEQDGYLDVTASGPASSPDGVEVATLETTARFDASGGWSDLSRPFGSAHQAAHGLFRRVVKPATSAR